MKSPLENLLSCYEFKTIDESHQALREIIQEIALLGLWRGKFFEHAAFYGGTAARIIHGLPRYSEDMDFSLLATNPDFRFKSFFPFLEKEFNAYGLDVEVEQKHAERISAIESAFVKINTRSGFVRLGVPQTLVNRLSREQNIKVKFEIDIDPPSGFNTETRFLYSPQAFSVKTFDLPSMFAGKLHAAIARTWKNRIKGRDWFDLIWFVEKGISASLEHLKARLIQTGHIDVQASFTQIEAKNLLIRRIESLDIEAAKKDVIPFLKSMDAERINIWCRDFFIDVADRIRFI